MFYVQVFTSDPNFRHLNKYVFRATQFPNSSGNLWVQFENGGSAVLPKSSYHIISEKEYNDGKKY